MVQAFTGIRVLELCHVIAAPYAAYLLALQGADVVKIEPPEEPDCVRGRGADPALNEKLLGANFLTQNGNKRSVMLDLKTADGRELLLHLCDDSDVLIENYRAGALEALGLGQLELRQRNPRLIYCSLTGYGHGGARSAVNAYDNVIQAASGLMAQTVDGDGNPVKTGASIIDYASGMAAAFAIASALNRRHRDGVGVHIDCSMLDTALALLGTDVTNALLAEDSPSERRIPLKESGLGCYETASGRLMLGAFNRRQHERLWRAFGREDFAAWSSWNDMARHADVMRVELSKQLLERDAESWEVWFHSIGVPAERVRSVVEGVALSDAQGRGFLQTLPVPGRTSIRVPTAPFRFSEDGPVIGTGAPSVGADTRAVLSELSGRAFHDPSAGERR